MLLTCPACGARFQPGPRPDAPAVVCPRCGVRVPGPPPPASPAAATGGPLPTPPGRARFVPPPPPSDADSRPNARPVLAVLLAGVGLLLLLILALAFLGPQRGTGAGSGQGSGVGNTTGDGTGQGAGGTGTDGNTDDPYAGRRARGVASSGDGEAAGTGTPAADATGDGGSAAAGQDATAAPTPAEGPAAPAAGDATPGPEPAAAAPPKPDAMPAPDGAEPAPPVTVGVVSEAGGPLPKATPIQPQASRPVTGPYGQRGNRAAAGSRGGATAESEAAVELGLEWLAKQQKDGHWGQRGTDVGHTGLALLAFLGAGYTHEEGKHRKTVRNALEWLCREQRRMNGEETRQDRDRDEPHTATARRSTRLEDSRGRRPEDYRPPRLEDFRSGLENQRARATAHRSRDDEDDAADALPFGLAAPGRADRKGCFSFQFYENGIATIALCEAYGMTGDRDLRKPAQDGIDCIVHNMGPNGGYGYTGAGDDVHVTSFQVMAAKAAKLAGLDVPKSITGKFVAYYDRALQSDGTTSYSSVGGHTTPARTALGLFCRVFLDVSKKDRNALKVADVLNEAGPELHDVFQTYYGSYGMFQMGGDYWKNWNRRFRDGVVDMQAKDGPDRGRWVTTGHGSDPVLATSLYVMSLEVYYRYLAVNR